MTISEENLSTQWINGWNFTLLAVVHTEQDPKQYHLPVGAMVAVFVSHVGHAVLIHSYHRSQASLVGCFSRLHTWSHHGCLHSEFFRSQF